MDNAWDVWVLKVNRPELRKTENFERKSATGGRKRGRGCWLAVIHLSESIRRGQLTWLNSKQTFLLNEHESTLSAPFCVPVFKVFLSYINHHQWNIIEFNWTFPYRQNRSYVKSFKWSIQIGGGARRQSCIRQKFSSFFYFVFLSA